MSVSKRPFHGSRLVVSAGLILVSSIYVLWQNINGQQSAVSPAQQFRDANEAFLQTISQLNASTTSPSQPYMQMMGSSGGMMRGIYTDGSYTGAPADAYYGTVQVAAFIRNGRIVDVQFLQHPDSRDTSRFINGQAMPLLTQEAIRVQNAQVNGVSGATFTSQAFQQSLASALAKAKN